MDKKIVSSAKYAIDDLLRLSLLGDSRLWVDYDKEADVLYINFGKPKEADNSFQEAGVITRKNGDKIVGVTVLNASKYSSNSN
ncbi:MAG: DUF2283 domain-containing protein [bacterium]